MDDGLVVFSVVSNSKGGRCCLVESSEVDFFFLITNHLEVVITARKSQRIGRTCNFVCPFDEDSFRFSLAR